MAYDSSFTTWLNSTESPVATNPLTVSCWFNADDTAHTGTIFHLAPSSGSDFFELRIDGSHASDPLETRSRSSTGGTSIARSSASFSSGTWHFGAGTHAGTGGANGTLAVWLDGQKDTDANAEWSNSDHVKTTVGRTSVGGSKLDGQIAELAVWNVVLSDAELLMLSKGLSPLCLTSRLANLTMYQDLIRPLNRPGIGPVLTENGSAIAAEHPRVITPAMLKIGYGGAPTIVGAPHCVEEGAIFVPTLVTGQEDLPGLLEGQIYSPGGIAGEVQC